MHSKISLAPLSKKSPAHKPGGGFSRHVFSNGDPIANYKKAFLPFFYLLSFLIATLGSGCSPAPAAAPTEAPPAQTPVPTQTESPRTPTPLAGQLVPLLPDWTTPPAGASDLEIARNALLAFFTYLHDGQFSEAAAYYGGPQDAVVVPNPDSPPADPGQFWEEACFLSQCLLVAGIVAEEQAASDEFHFLVEFMHDDGTLFVLGPCCGASEEDMPPVWQFSYTVRVIEGRMKVMEPPQYVP